MLVKFSSKHHADVLMFGDVATELFKAMGVHESARILRGEEIRQASEQLQAYLGRLPDDEPKEDDGEDGRDKEEKPKRVSLSHRALPLLELLDSALEEEDDVLWDFEG